MANSPSLLNSVERENVSLLDDSYIQPTLNHGLRIWWAFYWPTTLGATFLGLLLGKFLRQIYENSLISAKLIRYSAQAGGFILTYAVAFFVMYYILGKKFRGFRLALTSGAYGSSAKAVPRTYGRALRVWWIYVWRTLVYYALAYAFVIIPAGIFEGLFRPDPVFSTLFGAFLGFGVSAALGLFVIYSNILDEDIGDFHVSLLPLRAAVPDAAAPAGDPFRQKG